MAARPDFRVDQLLGTLTAHGVEFVVVGGIAATLLGSAHDTFDLDICPAADAGNLKSLARALDDLGARLRGIDDAVPFHANERTLKGIEVLTLETDHGWLDILMRPAGSPPFEQLRRRAERKDIGAFSVLVASLDDLIAMKRAAGRPKDEIMVEELEAVRRLRRRLRVRD